MTADLKLETALILPFEASSHRQLFVAVEEALLGAREAVSGARPQEVATAEPKWTCDAAGNWSVIPHERFVNERGYLADRRINSTPTGEQAP